MEKSSDESALDKSGPQVLGMKLDCGEGTWETGKKKRCSEGLDGQKEGKEKSHGKHNSRQSTPPLPPHSRHASSKYDFVKVRVWLGDNADHYYVLSRFLVSRMLTVTKIPNQVAIKISLELKKLLIDNSLLDVSQTDLEANLFKLMERRGYGEEYINRYKMMTRFHHQRVPLVILVCGTACVGKSTVATQLAQRLNLPNVLQTDMVYELIRTSTDAPLTSTPVWERDFPSSEELVTEFARECRIVRKGLDGDLRKAMKDGKPIIIEGIHLDPSIYLMDDESGGVTNQSNTFTITASLEERMPILNIKAEHLTDNQTINQETLKDLDKCIPHTVQVSFVSDAGVSNEVDSASVACAEHTSRDSVRNLFRQTCECCEKETCPDPGRDASSSSKHLQRSPAKAIFVPIVLKMDEFDQKTLLEEWIACRSNSGVLANEEGKEVLISKLMKIQDYLCSFKSQGATVVNISATAFPQALDGLHSYLLQRIEEGCQIMGARHPLEAPDPNLSS